MAELVRAAEMRAAEAAAIGSGGVTGDELMERAGAGLVREVLARWPELATMPQRAAVLCGPGNNGGDGLVVARLLAGCGWAVAVLLATDPARLTGEARTNFDRLPRQVRLRRLDEVSPAAWLAAAPGAPAAGPVGGDLVLVDALFGTGLTRPASGVAALIRAANRLKNPNGALHRIAVDIPSGICTDSGRLLAAVSGEAEAFAADLTVTFHRAKPGHFLADGGVAAGAVVVVDIGLPAGDAGAHLRVVDPPEGAALDKAGADGGSAHKYRHGHALVLAGRAGHGGAARLAARAALRAGAGLVTLGVPPDAVAENAARLDAVMLRPVADGGGLRDALRDPRINALCLGPGLGTGAREGGLLSAALAASDRHLVLDADALTLLVRDGGLAALPGKNCVLTPHGGEFARLAPDLAARLAAPAATGPAYSKVDAAIAAAARLGCIVVLKGADTVIAAPSGDCAIHAAFGARAAPWLATAGAGDVLAGIITGLLARGLPSMQAAEAAVWLHVEAARCFGPGLIAEDLPDALPQAFRALGL